MSRGKKGTKHDPAVPQEVLAELLKALGIGMLTTDACRFAGISQETFYKYVRVGPTLEPGHPMRVFAEQVAKTEASAKFRAVGRVASGMAKDWKAAAWWLGVSDPKNYGPKVRVTLEKEFGDAIANLEEEFAEQPDLLGKILNAITRERGAPGDSAAGIEASVEPLGPDAEPD